MERDGLDSLESEARSEDSSMICGCKTSWDWDTRLQCFESCTQISKYQAKAAISKEQFAAMRREMEDALRQQLIAQSNKGKGLRRTVSLFIWVVTLVAGSALGAYFKEVIVWIRSM